MLKMTNFRRWYDNDPILKEALELLKEQDDLTQSEAAKFMMQIKEQVAADVIERVYEIVNQYGDGKGNRWYDSDPFLLKAIEFLREAPPKVQRKAALKLLLALENNSFDNL